LNRFSGSFAPRSRPRSRYSPATARTRCAVTTGGLIAHIDRAWDKQGEIRQRIIERLPAVQERARQTNRIVVRVLSQIRAIAGVGGGA
jgi:hypothetical protein